MATQVETQPKNEEPTESAAESLLPTRTVVGWQGIRCVLPPDWNVTRYSLSYENGSLGIDAPGGGTMTVQMKWSALAAQQKGGSSLYSLMAPRFRRLLRRPEPPLPEPDLKANLERMFKETAKQAKKAKAPFESSLKPEKTEGEQGERTAINFSWHGAGRGQGKIWHCSVCNRIVIAQVLGANKDQSAMSAIAAKLFASLHDHAIDGYHLWGLYGLEMEIPDDFRLVEKPEPKLMSGYLQLIFTRGAERIVVDRWGLANMTLKKFTLDEWFRNNALIGLNRAKHAEMTTARGHEATYYKTDLSFGARLKAFRESRGGLRRFPTRYEGGAWHCPESNKIYAVQVLHSARTEGLWSEVVTRCVCH